MGIALITDLSSIPVANFLGPAIAVTALLVLTGLALEMKKLAVSVCSAAPCYLGRNHRR